MLISDSTAERGERLRQLAEGQAMATQIILAEAAHRAVDQARPVMRKSLERGLTL